MNAFEALVSLESIYARVLERDLCRAIGGGKIGGECIVELRDELKCFSNIVLGNIIV